MTNTIVIITAIIFVYLWRTYNTCVVRRNQVKEDLSDIDIQLKRRSDLIDQMVSIVKGYAKHEKETFENVAKARSQIMGAASLKDVAQGDALMSQSFGRLFAIAESYPELKADKSFMDLLQNMRDTEDQIAQFRQMYNTSVRGYNNTIQTFPNVIAATLFGFREEEYFEYSLVTSQASEEKTNSKKTV